MKFLCDHMLGTLAKWLRLFGFDTYYPSNDMIDDELIIIADEENRILITRDKELIQRANRKNIKVIEIKTIDLDEQLNLVIKKININKDLILSRCSVCNSILNSILKEEVDGKVPEKIFNNHKDFLYCLKCNKIYWKGSHYNNILTKIDKISNLI